MTNDSHKARFSGHARRAHTCSCGKVVHGNGGKAGHRAACNGHWLTSDEAYRLRAEQANRP